jgi:hypothetical protein
MGENSMTLVSLVADGSEPLGIRAVAEIESGGILSHEQHLLFTAFDPPDCRVAMARKNAFGTDRAAFDQAIATLARSPISAGLRDRCSRKCMDVGCHFTPAFHTP